ncbi:MAG: hypothetical protein RL757_1947 [Bacteroidota bacterium]|jgi:regulatory protein
MWKKKTKTFENKQPKAEKELSKSEALAKLESFCAYQERCEQEVRTRMKLLKIDNDLADDLIDSLLENDFLNQERFACAYARGKFRISSWGRVRIRQELQARRIGASLIAKALEEMTTTESYNEILNNLLESKSAMYDEKEPQRLEKIAGHALRRGFESDLVWAQIRVLFPRK